MHKPTAFLIGLITVCAVRAQVFYHLQYTDSSAPMVQVHMERAKPFAGPVAFVMPRSVPGAYGISNYDLFIEDISAINTKGEKVAMIKDIDGAPRWVAAQSDLPIAAINYRVNLREMEIRNNPSDASLIRKGFMGILNYSVFGWVDGYENDAVTCRISTFPNWPIFTTHNPAVVVPRGSTTIQTNNYHSLADGQIFAGPAFQIKEFKAIKPLYVVSYCETGNEWLDDYGWQAAESMSILNDYFGEVPFPHYSLMLSKALPLTPGDHSPFGMEHVQSATFWGDTTGKRTQPLSAAARIQTMPTYLHHMGHSIIPLSCNGDQYRPYVLEFPPIISNIWFNEGFMWFLPYDTLHLARLKNTFDNAVYKAPQALKNLSLTQLSQAASTMYALDFRYGQGIYSRGALMALEMDTYLKKESGGKKSMKDVFRYLYQWSKENKRPFRMDEFPAIISRATGISLSAIYEKWQLPIQ